LIQLKATTAAARQARAMVAIPVLAGASPSPLAAPPVSPPAPPASDRFGPATIVGAKALPTVFVVYTARGTLSPVAQAIPVTPTLDASLAAFRQDPLQRGFQTSQTGANVPRGYSRHGELIHQLTLLQSGSTYQYATGQKLLI
jgi:hypothetical protein